MRPRIASEPAELVGPASVSIAEAELIQRCRDGQSAAFGELVQRYQDRLFNVCWRMCGDRSEAEDFVQESFIKAIRSIDRFDGRAAFYTWLYRIAVNLVISERRRKRVGVVSETRQGDELLKIASPADGSDGPLKSASQSERQRLVESSLAELEDEQRVIVVLRDIDGLDYDEIATILDVPRGTVKSRLHRARMALREKLLPLLGGADAI